MIELPTAPPGPPTIPPFHVIVNFGSGVPGDAQGIVMLAMEKSLREMGFPAEVFKERMKDDSNLRNSMTTEKRKSL